MRVKSLGMAPGLSNARALGSAKFANAPPLGLTRQANAPAMHFCMGYHDQFSIDYSMFKTVLLTWCPELKAQSIHV